MTATVTDDGQLLLPAAIREKLHLKAGQTLEVHSVSPTEFIVRVAAEKHEEPRGDAFEMLGFAKKHGLEVMRTDEWMKILREGDED